MAKTWVLDTGTKGTGAHVVPLEEEPAKDAHDAAPHRRPPRQRSTARPRRERTERPPERHAAPLPEGHVRRKTTGEIGRIQSLDPRAGTATVLWLRRGSASTVPLSAISRR
jgi:hypothetical protein